MSTPNIGQKLTFRIVDFSGEDPQYPVTELLTGSPQSKGWQSQRFCDWPQQITFQFFAPVKLKQLQFLSHQSKISSKIELFMALPNLKVQGPDSELKFKKLGYLSLDSNERSGYQSRELKTVYIDAPCLYLKIVLNKCHLNKFNLFNQVGLIAVGIFGDPMSSAIPKELDQQKAKYDRLEYETQFDAVTVQKMKELEDAKTRAVEREDFDEAKKIKVAMERLRHLGSQLQNLEESKARAIKNEDYDSAKIIKMEIDKIREAIAPSSLGRQQTREIKEKPHVQFAQEEKQYQETPDDVSHKRKNFQEMNDQNQRNNRPPPPEHEKHEREEFKHEEPVVRNSVNAAEGRGLYNRQEHDEQVIPAMRNKPGGAQNFDEEYPPGGGPPGGDKGANDFEPLNANNSKHAEPLIPVIGEELACKVFSKSWNNREDALRTLDSDLSAGAKAKVINRSDNAAVFVALMGVAAHTINDKVAQVVLNCLNLLQTLLSQPPPNISSKAEVLSYIEGVMTGLLEKIGDNNARIKELAEQVFMAMAYNPIVTSAACVNALTKAANAKNKTANSTKHIVARLNLLTQLVSEFKINTKEVPYQPVVAYAVEKLENSSPEVRTAASKLLVEIYGIVGDRVKGDLAGVRQNQLDLLMKEFDAASGGGRHSPVHEEPKKAIVTTNINAHGAKKGAPKGGKGPASNAPPSGDDGAPTPLCEFCGRNDKNLKDPRKMDIHLWKECPILTTCESCTQIVEIPQLNKHLLDECDAKKVMRKCPRCKEAVHMDEYKQHTEEMSCLQSQPPTKANRCPLCHQDIAAGDAGWKQHLLTEGCPNNERTM